MIETAAQKDMKEASVYDGTWFYFSLLRSYSCCCCRRQGLRLQAAVVSSTAILFYVHLLITIRRVFFLSSNSVRRPQNVLENGVLHFLRHPFSHRSLP